MIRFKTTRYYLSDKGIQGKVSTLLIGSRELQAARNVHYFETGAWTKRNGYTKRFTNDISGTPILTGLYEFTKINGTKYFIASADKLYTGSDGDASPSTIAGGLTFTPGTNGENFMSFVTFNNKAIGTNGIENLWQFNGSTASTLAGNPPVAPIIALFHNFIFLAGNSTYPFRLYFSNDGVETAWTATDYIDIGDLTSPITGLGVLFGKLYIFTRKSMYELRGYDRDTFSVDEVSLSTGCVSYKSVVKVDNNLVFWSDRGPYSFDGINVHYLGSNVEPNVSLYNYNRTNYIVAELYKAKNQIWFSLSTGSNSRNNQVLCMTYDPTASESSGINRDNISFAEYTGMAFNCFGLETSTTQIDRLYSGNYSGRIHQQDKGGNDDGNGIDFYVKSPPIDTGEPDQFKRFRYIWIFNKQEGNYNLSISYNTDFGITGTTVTNSLSVAGSASLWGTMVWGKNVWGGNTIIKSRIGLKAHGHWIELVFSNSNAEQPIVIKGFSIISQTKGHGRR